MVSIGQRHMLCSLFNEQILHQSKRKTPTLSIQDFWISEKVSKKAIGVVEKDPIINKDTLQEIVNNHDFEDQYAHAHEDIDERFPKQRGENYWYQYFLTVTMHTIE